MRIARRVGRMMLEEMGVISTDVNDTEFVVGELCSNVIRHAQTSDGRFVIHLEYHADKVVITVMDRGTGFSFKDVGEVGSLRPDMDGSDRYGGFGLDLVRRLADHVEFSRTDPDGTTVRAEKVLHYKTPEAAREAEEMEREGAQMSVTG